MAENKEITFKIVQKIAVLGQSKTGWTTELNVVSWNDRTPKFDLRDWSPDHTKMSKGTTFTLYEVEKLYEAFGKVLKKKSA